MGFGLGRPLFSSSPIFAVKCGRRHYILGFKRVNPIRNAVVASFGHRTMPPNVVAYWECLNRHSMPADDEANPRVRFRHTCIRMSAFNRPRSLAFPHTPSASGY